MQITFKYSLIEEVKNAVDTVFHKSDYKDLRSVVMPSLKGLISFGINRDIHLKHIDGVWHGIEPKFNEALKTAGLIPGKDKVICYIHSAGCEGWFNIDNYTVNIRITNSSDRNTVDSIMHELLHLLTYKKGSSYGERESQVDAYMITPAFQSVLADVAEPE